MTKTQQNASRPNRVKFVAATIATVIGLSACVTVNVNFPESAVQKATDDYVKELYRAKEKGRGTTPATPAGADKPASEPAAKPSGTTSWNFILIESAQAADASLDFRLDSPKALKIRDKLSARLDAILKYKRDGVLGETNNGSLEIHNSAPLKKAKLMAKPVAGKPAEDPVKTVEDLVKSENKDRADLYEEVLSANNIGKNRLKDLQKSFARSFQAESPSGTWVQESDGGWSQKK